MTREDSIMAGPPLMQGRQTQSHEMQDAHSRGECRPCAYFWHKSDGCRWGDACQFCHSCDREALKKQKKAKRQRMKAQAQALYRHDAVGAPKDLKARSLREAYPRNVPIGEPLRVEFRPPPGLARTPFPHPGFPGPAGGSDDGSSASTTPTAGKKDPYDLTDNYDLAADLARYALTVNSTDMIPTPKWAEPRKGAGTNRNKIGCYGYVFTVNGTDMAPTPQWAGPRGGAVDKGDNIGGDGRARAAPTSAVWALVPEDPVLPAFIESTLATFGGNNAAPGEGCASYARGDSIMESPPSWALQFEDMFPELHVRVN